MGLIQSVKYSAVNNNRMEVELMMTIFEQCSVFTVNCNSSFELNLLIAVSKVRHGPTAKTLLKQVVYFDNQSSML